MIKSIFDKILSGRFIATIAIVYTYCNIVNTAVFTYVMALKSDPSKMEAFAVGLIMGFAGTATLVIKSYFDRNDRQQGGING